MIDSHGNFFFILLAYVHIAFQNFSSGGQGIMLRSNERNRAKAQENTSDCLAKK